MSRSTARIVAWLSVALLALTSTGISLAAPAAPPAPTADDQPPAGPRTAIDPLLRRSGPVKVVVELEQPASAAAYASALEAAAAEPDAARAARAQHARVELAQQRLLAPIGQLGGEVIYRVQTVYNGIALRVDAAELDRLAALPGVKAIHRLVSKELHHTGSVPLVGAPAVWGGASGAAGQGVSIGIIDSGIDYVHRNFGGTGDYTGVTDTSAPAFNAKVVGGYDFVGDSYDARFADKDTPAPDANPIDCLKPNPGTVGHGTHVAGSAGGIGVKSDGTAYTGAYDASTFTGNTFRIAPGVAPRAELYALRVFGCDGSTDFADLAIEWAVDPNGDGDPSDHLDVINMSLGSDFGANFDSTSRAAEAAVAAGVIVVASAGNSEDTTYITGSPGSSDAVISVASSTQPDTVVDGLTVNPPAAIAGTKPASFSVNYPWATASDVSADVYFTGLNGCTALSAGDAALVAGKAVLLNWADGQCGSGARANTFKAAGAAGLIIADNSDVFDLLLSGNATLPTVSVPKAVGAQLQAAAGSGTVNVTFDGDLLDSGMVTDASSSDMISSFSSRGPSRSGALKPDITAPGSAIFSALAGSGSRGQTLQGTSMAAPHVAGAMAILRQLHPDWTPAQLKALVMNTAANDLRSGVAVTAQAYGPARQGAGRLDVPAAAAGTVLAYDTARPDRVSVTFGNVGVVAATQLTRSVSVTNRGAAAASFDLAYSPVTTIPGVSYTVSPAALTLAAGETQTAVVTLSVDPTAMKNTLDATMSSTQNGFPRYSISDASGYLTLTPSGQPTLQFKANIRGYYENPPVAASVFGVGEFTFTAATRELSYNITFSGAFTPSAAHIHSGPAGTNGNVVVPLPAPAGSPPVYSGTAALSIAQAELLLKGELYVNFHTVANPGGEVRGQIVPADPALRLPVYSAPIPSSDMQSGGAGLGAVNPDGTATGSIQLSGSGVNTGSSLPADTLSLVTALELQHVSSRATATDVITGYSDLQYVGVSSDLPSAGSVANSTLYFGVATHKNWGTPNEAYFEIQIYTDDGDEAIDYALFTTNSGTSDANDDMYTALATFDAEGNLEDIIDQYPLNVLGPNQANTRVFNTNVVVLAVDAADLGLTAEKSSFTYQVLSDSNGVDNAVFDFTPSLTYNLTKPAFSFQSGYGGLSAYKDLPGEQIPYAFNRDNLIANGSHGILLLHHHNLSGDRAEVLTDAFDGFDAVAPSATWPVDPAKQNVVAAAQWSTTYSFEVAYRDNWLVDGATLRTARVRVTGPNGFSQVAQVKMGGLGLDRLDPQIFDSARSIQVGYEIKAPGGSWDLRDNGTYTIAIEAGQFEDLAGNPNPAITLGTFTAQLSETRLYLPMLARR